MACLLVTGCASTGAKHMEAGMPAASIAYPPNVAAARSLGLGSRVRGIDVRSPLPPEGFSNETGLLLKKGECPVGLTNTECRKRSDKTAEEMRDEAFDRLSDRLFHGFGQTKVGRLRLKKDRLEWQLKF